MFSTELRKVIAFTVFVGLVLTAFYFFFWHPSKNSLKKKQEEINRNERLLAQIKRDVETWPKTKTEENLKKAEEKLQELLAKIPEEEDIPGILEHIQKYGATAAHLNIVGITNITGKATKQKPHEDKEESTYDKVTYKLTADGSFLDVIRFLRGLEAAERLIVIEDLNIKRGSDEKKSSVHAEVTLGLFYSKPELVISEKGEDTPVTVEPPSGRDVFKLPWQEENKEPLPPPSVQPAPTLSTICWSDDLPLAIINGEILTKGDKDSESQFRVETITRDKVGVRFIGDGKYVWLILSDER